MDLLLSKEATNFIAKGVALASVLQTELTEDNRREINRCYHIAIFRTISITWVHQNIEIKISLIKSIVYIIFPTFPYQNNILFLKYLSSNRGSHFHALNEFLSSDWSLLNKDHTSIQTDHVYIIESRNRKECQICTHYRVTKLGVKPQIARRSYRIITPHRYTKPGVKPQICSYNR